MQEQISQLKRIKSLFPISLQFRDIIKVNDPSIRLKENMKRVLCRAHL